MKSLKTVSDRSGEIATQADGLKSPQELRVFANEITQLIKTAVDVANTKFKGDYIFAGTKSDSPAYVITTDASGTVTGVTYQGNATVPAHEISEGETISAQVPGANTTGSGPQGLIADTRTGADFFNHLIALQNHLLAGDTAAVAATDRAALGKDEDNFVFQLGANGALQARLETQNTILGQRKQSVTTLTSNEVDADLATTLVQLNQSQNAYQVALQSGAQLFRQSLLDFLH
jgi:flagellar hook-associated protein 3 FlgL